MGSSLILGIGTASMAIAEPMRYTDCRIRARQCLGFPSYSERSRFNARQKLDDVNAWKARG